MGLFKRKEGKKQVRVEVGTMGDLDLKRLLILLQANKFKPVIKETPNGITYIKVDPTEDTWFKTRENFEQQTEELEAERRANEEYIRNKEREIEELQKSINEKKGISNMIKQPTYIHQEQPQEAYEEEIEEEYEEVRPKKKVVKKKGLTKSISQQIIEEEERKPVDISNKFSNFGSNKKEGAFKYG